MGVEKGAKASSSWYEATTATIASSATAAKPRVPRICSRFIGVQAHTFSFRFQLSKFRFQCFCRGALLVFWSFVVIAIRSRRRSSRIVISGFGLLALLQFFHQLLS